MVNCRYLPKNNEFLAGKYSLPLITKNKVLKNLIKVNLFIYIVWLVKIPVVTVIAYRDVFGENVY
jgi:hypothetical protein